MPSKNFSLASFLCLWLTFTVTDAQTFYANVLQAAAARTPGSISVAATPAQTLPSAADRATLYDGLFLDIPNLTTWGVCFLSSLSSSTVDITSTTPLKARSILTALSTSTTVSDAGVSLKTALNGVVVAELTKSSADASLTGNFQLYSPIAKTFSTINVKVNPGSSGPAARICTPEIFVSDAHILFNNQNSKHTHYVRQTRLSDGYIAPQNQNISGIPPVFKNTWKLDGSTSTCNLISQTSATFRFDFFVEFGPTGSFDTDLSTIKLVVAYFIVLGPNFSATSSEVPNSVEACTSLPVVDFSARTFSDSPYTTDVKCSYGTMPQRSGIVRVSNDNQGYIGWRTKMQFKGTGNFHICRFQPLGYPYCQIQNIADTTATTNQYLITPASAQPAIVKSFTQTFLIDSDGYFQNNAFCSYGISASITACSPSCGSYTAVATPSDTGTISVTISTSDILNYGEKTFTLTARDTRNTAEQPAGLTFNFGITFDTCTLTVGSQPDQVYVIGGTQQTFGLQSLTESSTCGFTPACTLGSTAPTWVSVSTGCTFVWPPASASLVPGLYTIPVSISYAPIPTPRSYSTSFKICLLPSTYQFSGAYTVKDAEGSLVLTATNDCGYSVTLSRVGTEPTWVNFDENSSTASWYTEDLTLEAKTYSATINAEFNTTPTPTVIQTTLSIVLSLCDQGNEFQLDSPKDYTIKNSRGSQVLQAVDNCGYEITYEAVGIWPDWIHLDLTTSQTEKQVWWQTDVLSLPEGPYEVEIKAKFSSTPTERTQNLRIQVTRCDQSNDFQIDSNSPVYYTVKGTEMTYTLEAEDYCGYPITYSKGSQWPDWGVDLTDSVTAWYTDDLNLAAGQYEVELVATFLSTPSERTQTLIIDLSRCDLGNDFPIDSPQEYTVKGSEMTYTLEAEDYCGYPVQYEVVGIWPEWIHLDSTSKTLSWETDDLSLEEETFDVVIRATFSSIPVTRDQTLSIQLNPCDLDRAFVLSEVTHQVKGGLQSQQLQATDDCGYQITYSKVGTWPDWLDLDLTDPANQYVWWNCVDLLLDAGVYSFEIKAEFYGGIRLQATITSTLVINLQSCQSVKDFALSQPQVSYAVKDKKSSQTISQITDSCGYAVEFSIISSEFIGVSLSEQTVWWESTDLALEEGNYEVVIEAEFKTRPQSEKVRKTLTISLQYCDPQEEAFQLNKPTVQYTVKDPKGSQALLATEKCGYPITYTVGTTLMTGVEIVDQTLYWENTNLELEEKTYEFLVTATIQSKPDATELTQTFSITVSSCVGTMLLESPSDQIYNFKSPSNSQIILVSDDSDCDYQPTCSKQSNFPEFVSLNDCEVSWFTTDSQYLVTPVYTVPILVTLGKIQRQTSFKITIANCVQSYELTKPSDQTYELGTPGSSQALQFQKTGTSECDLFPTCSIVSAPSWVHCSDSCVCSWYSASLTLPTPSNNQVIVNLSYIDYQTGSLVQEDQTEFLIKLIPNTGACKTAQIQFLSTSLISLSINQKVQANFTPTDTVSEKFKHANYCGSYVIVWPTTYPEWLKVSTGDFEAELTQTAYGLSSFDMVLHFSLSNHPDVVASQTIKVIRENCVVKSFLPSFSSKEVEYLIGSGKQKVSMPLYQSNPECTTHYLYSLSFEQTSGPQLESCIISKESFEIFIDNEAFKDSKLTFKVTASLTDEAGTQNSDFVLTVLVIQPKKGSTITTSPNVTDTPTFSLPLLQPMAIPCLRTDAAADWEYTTPPIISTRPIEYQLSSPGLDSLFLVSFENKVLTLKLDTENAKQPFPGEFPSIFTLNYKRRHVLESKAQISFKIDCDAKFATAELILKPKPKIAIVTGTGLVTIKWNTIVAVNEKENQISGGRRLSALDLAFLKNQTVEIDGFKAPAILVEINPGDPDEDRRNLGFDYSFEQVTARNLVIQLKIEKPDKISESQYTQDKIELTFNDPYLFQSTVSGMYIERGYRVSANLPRQSLPGQLTVSMGSAVQVTKGVMLAAAAMPFLLSAVLSQLLSVIHSITIIVHMMTIQILLPANCVAFFALLAPLVIFDLLPTGSLAEKIFQFPQLQNDDPLTVQFSSIGYNSQLIVQNMGSMFFIMIFYVVLVVLLFMLRAVIPAAIKKTKAGQKFNGIIGQFISNAFWSTPISFFFESYFILCVMSFIGTQALVFGNVEIWSQIFCSVLAVVGAAFSVLFPFCIGIIYFRKIKNVPTISPEKLDNYDRHQTYGTFDIDRINKDFFTQNQYQAFLKRYGVLVKEYDLERVGVRATILTVLFDLLRRLVLALVICYLGRYPIVFIITFNFTSLFYLMHVLYHLPIQEATEQTRSIVNELTILAVNYHLICMSDFVGTTQAQSMVANSLIGLILLNCLVNVLLSIYNPIYKLVPYVKRFYFRQVSVRKRKNNPVKVQGENGKPDQAVVGLTRRKVVPPEIVVANEPATFRANVLSEIGQMSPIRAQIGLVLEDHEVLKQTATSHLNPFSSPLENLAEQQIDGDEIGTEFRQPANSWRQLIKASESFFSNTNLGEIEEVPEVDSNGQQQ